MIVPLTLAHASDAAAATSTAAVGGKASSLAKLYSIEALKRAYQTSDKLRCKQIRSEKYNVPESYALSTEFFRPWLELVENTDDYARIIRGIGSPSSDGEIENACERLKRACLTTPLNASQEKALGELSDIVATFDHALAAVRSSAVEEDGSDLSYAGMFETELGVSPSKLEWAVRRCFASKFDYRVFQYSATHNDDRGRTVAALPGFALVVMEMIDSVVAGVSFSANPLNSDRDECVIDSSYGLGETVVDGRVTADRFIYDKVHGKLVDKIIGRKRVERRLNLVEGGEVNTISIDDEQRQKSPSLSDDQLGQLARLTCIVEEEYGMPMDVEFALKSDSQLVLLQARPITTLFSIDENMMTKPGEKRVLYYDSNVAADATTTNPFTHMDIEIYCRMTNIAGGMSEDARIIKDDPRMPLFNASTRQYANMSMVFKYFSTEYCAKEASLLDPYTSSLFASKDCDREKYRMKKLPKGVNISNAIWLFRQVHIWNFYKIGKKFKKDPERAKANYQQIVKDDMAKLKSLETRGYNVEEGLLQFSHDLIHCIMPSMTEEMGLLFFVVLQKYKQMDKKRREGSSEQIRSEYDALCNGYEGDELIQINIDMFQLANKLDFNVWEQYDHDELHQLAERIRKNLDGTLSDLPNDFLSGWKEFMDCHGYDGEDQMFISSPRYQDDSVLLLARLRQNTGAYAKDPAKKQQDQVARRKKVMKLHEDEARSNRLTKQFLLSRIQKRNIILDHLMWIRNAPKLHIARVVGILRANVIRAEKELIESGRLETKGDIFHLALEEVDKALEDSSFDLIHLLKPRKAVYERACRSKECPILIDSRCRILRPDPPSQNDIEKGTLVGAAVSPGSATGCVRILRCPTDRFERGEVLAATVTSPAWTPLFVGASAIILQIGGTLQHGALCAREMGIPAVTNIDIHNVLKTGMIVTVDGNTGTVKINDETCGT